MFCIEIDEEIIMFDMFDNQVVGKGIVFDEFTDNGEVVRVEDATKVVVSTDPLVTVTRHEPRGLVWIYNWHTEEGMWLDRKALLGVLL